MCVLHAERVLTNCLVKNISVGMGLPDEGPWNRGKFMCLLLGEGRGD